MIPVLLLLRQGMILEAPVHRDRHGLQVDLRLRPARRWRPRNGGIPFRTYFRQDDAAVTPDPPKVIPGPVTCGAPCKVIVPRGHLRRWRRHEWIGDPPLDRPLLPRSSRLLRPGGLRPGGGIYLLAGPSPPRATGTLSGGTATLGLPSGRRGRRFGPLDGLRGRWHLWLRGTFDHHHRDRTIRRWLNGTGGGARRSDTGLPKRLSEALSMAPGYIQLILEGFDGRTLTFTHPRYLAVLPLRHLSHCGKRAPYLPQLLLLPIQLATLVLYTPDKEVPTLAVRAAYSRKDGIARRDGRSLPQGWRKGWPRHGQRSRLLRRNRRAYEG